MYNADTIEAINADQIATATDRLLLRGGRPSRYTHQARSLANATTWAPHTRTRSRTCAALDIPSLNERLIETVVMRRPSSLRTQLIASAVALPVLFGIALGVTALV